jgi:LAO/AO transport system kinase
VAYQPAPKGCDSMSLVERVLAGDRLALARLLSQIENEETTGLDDLAALYPHTGGAHLVGVTGAPGTGKSTLVNKLVLRMRQVGDEDSESSIRIAVVAVDPSSPFTGGAILGDRIRMRDLAGDPCVFIRSMASRGALGGLARATTGVVQALDAAGFDVIMIETVGAGQAEVDIARTAHTTVVITAPGMGDEVQAIKAGILEIADILVVNKADIPGADNTLRALRATLEMAKPEKYALNLSHHDDPGMEHGEESNGWETPVIATIATEGDGVTELIRAIEDHRTYLRGSGEWTIRERGRIRSEMEWLLRDYLAARFLQRQPDGRFEEALEKVLSRSLSPRQAVLSMLEGEDE